MSESSYQPTRESDLSRLGRSLLVPDARRDWSKRQIEGFLTDVCAELYRLEAERRQAKRMISAVSELCENDRTGAEAEAQALWQRYCTTESRLQDLAPVAAGLRARLKLLARDRA